MGDLDKATWPEPSGSPGVFDVLLDAQWGIGEKLHGGYLLAVLARAAMAAVGETRPAHVVPQAVTGTFLRAPVPGPAAVTVDVLRTGRGASQARVTLRQDGEPGVDATVVLGPAPDPEVVADVAPPPVDLPAFSDCERRPADNDGRGTLPLMDVVDTRLDPATGMLHGRPTGAGRVSGWMELDTREPWSPLGLLVAVDVLPPATFDLGIVGWTPTLSLTAHVHGVPAPGPLRATQWVDHLAGDRLYELCHVWDTTGRLVGQASQLAAVRR